MTAAWAGSPFTAEEPAGAADAAPDWTAAASRALTPTTARVWEARLREELLLNTDSFCVAADHTARGDPDGGSTARAELGWSCGVAVLKLWEGWQENPVLSGARHELGRNWFVVRWFMFDMRTHCWILSGDRLLR